MAPMAPMASWPTWPPPWPPETRCQPLHSEADLRSYQGKVDNAAWISDLEMKHCKTPKHYPNQAELTKSTKKILAFHKPKWHVTHGHRSWSSGRKRKRPCHVRCQKLGSKIPQKRLFLQVKCMVEGVFQFWTFKWGWPQNSSPSSSQTSKMQRLERTCRNWGLICPNRSNGKEQTCSNYLSPPKQSLIYLMPELSW